MSKLKITQTKSTINRPADQRLTIKALGLKRIRHSVVHEDSPSLQGMLFKVKHMVEVEELDAAES